jgi:tripartite-type tricarboxylate transporter receptor subunit TctC
MTAALAAPEPKARLAELGVEPMPMTPAQFSKFIDSENEKWGKVIRAADIRLD